MPPSPTTIKPRAFLQSLKIQIVAEPNIQATVKVSCPIPIIFLLSIEIKNCRRYLNLMSSPCPSHNKKIAL